MAGYYNNSKERENFWSNVKPQDGHLHTASFYSYGIQAGEVCEEVLSQMYNKGYEIKDVKMAPDGSNMIMLVLYK